MAVTTVIYDTLCPPGRNLQAGVTRAGGIVRQAVGLAESPEPALDAVDQVVTAKRRLEAAKIELSRHVAHCTDGCKRAATTEQAPAFSGSAYDRAPVRKKPPLPTPVELAQMVRDGSDIYALADQYERTSSTIRQLMTRAGYSSTTGQPRVASELDTPILTKPFKYEQWMDNGLCGQTDPDSFFPEKGGSTREAKAICRSCTVAAEFLDYALTNQERFGIWGGLSERERRKLQNFPTDREDIHHQETA